jgi:hypothetical protein
MANQIYEVRPGKLRLNLVGRDSIARQLESRLAHSTDRRMRKFGGKFGAITVHTDAYDAHKTSGFAFLHLNSSIPEDIVLWTLQDLGVEPAMVYLP